MTEKAEHWSLLADEITAARVRRGYTSRKLFAGAAGIGTSTIERLETGKPRARLPTRVAEVETALGWLPGTIRRILYDGYRPSAELPRNPDADSFLAYITDFEDAGTIAERLRLRRADVAQWAHRPPDIPTVYHLSLIYRRPAVEALTAAGYLSTRDLAMGQKPRETAFPDQAEQDIWDSAEYLDDDERWAVIAGVRQSRRIRQQGREKLHRA